MSSGGHVWVPKGSGETERGHLGKGKWYHVSSLPSGSREESREHLGWPHHTGFTCGWPACAHTTSCFFNPHWGVKLVPMSKRSCVLALLQGKSLGDSLGTVSWGRTWGWVAVLNVNFIPWEALCPLGQLHELPALARAMSGKWSVLCSGPEWVDLEDSYVGSFSHWGTEPCKEPGRGAKRKELRFLQWWTPEGELAYPAGQR